VTPRITRSQDRKRMLKIFAVVGALALVIALVVGVVALVSNPLTAMLAILSLADGLHVVWKITRWLFAKIVTWLSR
jgi:hypothetical protein